MLVPVGSSSVSHRRLMLSAVFLLPAVLVMVVSLTGCESSTDVEPPERSTGSPAPGTADTIGPQMLELRDDLIDLRPVEWYDEGFPEQWDDWELIDQRTVRLYFFAGRAACHGAEAAVVESDDSVHITVRVGTIPPESRTTLDNGTPPGSNSVCPSDALTSAVDVRLDGPLGNRTFTYD